MPIAVGIDLGTTRTAIGVYLNGEIKIIPSQTGKPFIPSCVAFTKNECLVGDRAEEQAIDNPTNTIYDIKRIIGRKFDDLFLQEDKKRLPYKIENHKGKPKICVTYKENERLYDPEEISAMVVKKIVQNAEVILGHQITGAVITVPTYFNDSQRQATRNAGIIAGLEVLHILNEPIAAAIAYGLDKTLEDEKNILIYDLGSGKFDASIMKLKRGNIFEVKSTVGDTDVGGMNFDLKIIDYIADCFYNEHGIDIRGNKYATRRLKIACEQAKTYLTNSEEVVVKVDSIIDNTDLNITITKSKFEDLCEPLIKRTMDLLLQVLHDSGVDKNDIHDIILVGGSSRIPKIRSLISDFFDGKFICSCVNADAAVTYGAAVKAAILSGYKDKKIKDLLFVDFIPHSIGIETSGGVMTIVIEKNTSIPCKAIYTFTTNEDNQPGITLLIFEGEKELTKDNHHLGKLELFGLPPFPRGVPQIEVTFQIDSDSILTVSTEGDSYIKSRSVSIRLDKGRPSLDPTVPTLKENQKLQKEEDNLRNRIQYKNGLENYVSSVRKAARLLLPDKISDRDVLEIHKICNEIEDWLQRNPKAAIDALTEKRKLAVKLLHPYASVLEQIVKVKKIKGSIPISDTTNSDAGINK